MLKNFCTLATLVLAALTIAPNASAQTSSEKNVYDFNFVYTADLVSTSGGLVNGKAYLDNFDFTLETDLESLFGWNDSTLMVYVIGNQGSSPSALIGDTQGVSNIDAPDTWKLYELWYQRNWKDDRFSLRAGLYDYNSEFDVIETAGLFINSSFGIGPESSQSGENGPSIFPTTAVALRGLFTAENGYYIQAVILDGVAGDPNQSHGTRIKLDSDEGLMLGLEAGRYSDHGKIALGAWRYTKKVNQSANGLDITPQHNQGIYALGETQLYAEDDGSQGLSGFLRFGIADSDINQLDRFWGAGIVYTGLLPRRNEESTRSCNRKRHE